MNNIFEKYVFYEQNKEALVGKYTKTNNPSDNNAPFNFDPSPLCRTVNFLQIFTSNLQSILQLTIVMILKLLIDNASFHFTTTLWRNVDAPKGLRVALEFDFRGVPSIKNTPILAFDFNLSRDRGVPVGPSRCVGS